MATTPRLQVREMQVAEVGVRIDYFHDSSDEYLRTLGVDRASLPSKEAWRAAYVEDVARPIEHRQGIALVWELDGRIVGFSTADRIVFGEEAFMHLHIVSPGQRRHGFGTEFVKESARYYWRVLRLQRLYSEPNAFNVAPNRTLQRAGFAYLFTHETKPGPINFHQVTTRWTVGRDQLKVRSEPGLS
jgi:RimJ/RimL family protein N-acetyltransferase